MSNSPNTPRILLIVFVVLAGVGLGWIARDLVFGTPSVSPPIAEIVPPTIIRTATQVEPTLEPATPTLTPTAAPFIVQATLTATATPLPVPTAEPTWTPEPTPILPGSTPPPPDPNQMPIIGYSSYIVQPGDTLFTIAEIGGSEALLIAIYNNIIGQPEVGQALIIPQLEGRTSQLQNPPTLIIRGPNVQPYVAITLDAGAGSAPTPKILAALRERGVRITFFLTGKWIRENPDLARQIVSDGHEIANHTTSHPDLRQLDDAAIRQELADTEAAMREVAGVGTKPYFRPPFGAYDDRVLRLVQSEGYLPIYWTLDSLDSVGEPKTAEFLLERITTKLTAEQLRGAIILAHCGNPSTAEALPAILDRLNEMGFEVRRLSDILGAKAQE